MIDDSEFEMLARQIEVIGSPGFDLQCSVAVDAATGEIVIVVMAINIIDPDSQAVPALTVPTGWLLSEVWYHAAAAGTVVGSITKDRRK